MYLLEIFFVASEFLLFLKRFKIQLSVFWNAHSIKRELFPLGLQAKLQWHGYPLERRIA